MGYRKESPELNLRFCDCITKIEQVKLPVSIYVYTQCPRFAMLQRKMGCRFIDRSFQGTCLLSTRVRSLFHSFTWRCHENGQWCRFENFQLHTSCHPASSHWSLNHRSSKNNWSHNLFTSSFPQRLLIPSQCVLHAAHVFRAISPHILGLMWPDCKLSWWF